MEHYTALLPGEQPLGDLDVGPVQRLQARQHGDHKVSVILEAGTGVACHKPG